MSLCGPGSPNPTLLMISLQCHNVITDTTVVRLTKPRVLIIIKAYTTIFTIRTSNAVAKPGTGLQTRLQATARRYSKRTKNASIDRLVTK